jgi:hypothetical protein
LANIPTSSEYGEFKKNPYVWAACTRFVLTRDCFDKTFSPSSDKNTFLICSFDTDSIDQIYFHEFKVLQNNPTQNTRGHNSWVLIDSQKCLEIDENLNVEDLVKKSSIF